MNLEFNKNEDVLKQSLSEMRQRLEKIFELKAGKQSPHDWAQHFTTLLDAAGFPGERASDSAEYQTRARFNGNL